MKFVKNTIYLVAIALFISSCAKGKDGAAIKSYSNDKIKIDVRKHLNGNLSGFGIWKNKDGVVTKRFTIDVNGSWEGNKGVIKEVLSFDDNSKDSRTWLFSMNDENSFEAIGHGIVGTGKGEQYGGALEMSYVMSMMVNGKKQNFVVDDWTYMVNDKSLISVIILKSSGSFGSGSNEGKIIISLKKSDNISDSKSDNAKNSAKSLDKNIEEKAN